VGEGSNDPDKKKKKGVRVSIYVQNQNPIDYLSEPSGYGEPMR